MPALQLSFIKNTAPLMSDPCLDSFSEAIDRWWGGDVMPPHWLF